MESEIEGFREKPTAAEPANANQNPNSELDTAKIASQSREEGELSASDTENDVELPARSVEPDVPSDSATQERHIHSAVQELPPRPAAQEILARSNVRATGTFAPPSEPILAPPANKSMEGAKAGKLVSTNNLASSIGNYSRRSVQPSYHRSIDKNQGPFKSGPPGWYVPSGATNNLVIRFSDDDSGSDSEEYRQEQTLDTKSSRIGIDRTRRPPAPFQSKPVALQRNTRNGNKEAPKKLSLSRTFNSSIAKIRGAVSKGAGSSLIEQGSHFSNSNKNIASRECQRDQGVGLMNNSKLQDLRHQIAMRESELKLKSTQQNKEAVPSSFRDYEASNLNSDAARNHGATSADIVQFDPKEPDNKRLKVNGSYFSQKNSDGQLEIPTAKSFLALKEPVLENSGLPDRNKVAHSQFNPMGRTESSIVKWQKKDDKQGALSADNLPGGVKDGDEINTSCTQSDRGTKQIDPYVVSKSNQSAPLANMISNTSQNNITSRHTTSHWNCLGNDNGPRNSNMDIQSLVEMEDSLDKELEEAQEHRRRCEVEERNALKAYRKAQRALVEANARCTYLYRQRDLYSSQFQSFIVDDSSLSWPSRQREHVGIELRSTNNMSEVNVDQIPMSSHQMQVEFDGFNQPGHDSNIQAVSGTLLNTSYQHVSGQNLGSEPCSEPDASTSDLLPHREKNAASGVCSPSNDPSISADEDEETFPYHHESIQPILEGKIKKRKFEEGEKGTENGSNKKFSLESSQDSLILEANLRSELFARLGVRTLSKNSNAHYSMEPAVERGAENDVRSEKPQMRSGSVKLPEVERIKQSDLTGTNQLERSISEVPLQNNDHCHVEECSLKSNTTADPDRNEFFFRDHSSVTALSISPHSVLRSAFSHMIVVPSVGFIALQTRDQQNHTCDIFKKVGNGVDSGETQPSILIANSIQETTKDTSGRDIGCYSCSLAVDLFWPLCMYELRGKCNNDECSWQHVKDYSEKNTNQHEDSNTADYQVGSSSHWGNCNGSKKLSKHLNVSVKPAYLVGLDILKADLLSYEPVLPWGSGECWKKCFSISLAVSRLPQKDFPADESFLHDSGRRIEVHGSWNRQSLYFQSRNGTVTQLKQGLTDNDQALEMALFILNQEVNKLDGVKKAFSVLSQALEADPMSVVLWVVYLLIYYANKTSIGKDDMFAYAVKHNPGSYELWLMYINSRIKLNIRLAAFDAALSALCRHASASDRVHASACILDLFLQMVDCLCMSGNAGKAIQRVDGLLPDATNSDERHSLLLSDILSSLTISDKCIFWVSCMYLVIYRKLPDVVFEMFEGEKEISAIQWPSIRLRNDEKQRALNVVEMAVDSVESYINGESLQTETTLRSAQLFALNHIRCMAVLESLDYSRNLLDKYIKLYPSCLDLVLISARAQKDNSGGLSFVGFEEAITNWPKGVPGIQCIWNQYAEYALQNGRTDFAKEIMIRWFQSVVKGRYLQSGILDALDCDNSRGFLESVFASNLDTSISNSNQKDVMFGFLNLSLHRLLENDQVGARVAIDCSLKAASAENYKHCMREHARFLFADGSQLKDDASISGLLKFLNSYLVDTQAFSIFEALPWKFIDNIKKQRVQQLVSNMLSPLSSNSSLVNLVLEAWYGPSLLPQKFSKLKDLISFVEAIMEFCPSNYRLAISVYKLLSRGSCPGDVPPASVSYWASLLMINSIFQAMPIAPEYVWVEAAGILSNLTGIEAISERLFKRALSVYPFSIRLWKLYCDLLKKTNGDLSTVIEASRERGIKLN